MTNILFMCISIVCKTSTESCAVQVKPSKSGTLDQHNYSCKNAIEKFLDTIDKYHFLGFLYLKKLIGRLLINCKLHFSLTVYTL